MKISAFFTTVQQVFLSIILALSLILGGDGEVGVAYQAKNPNELLYSFSVISDSHIESNAFEKYQDFVTTLRGMKAGESIEAAVFLGDNVMNGQGFESFLFYTALKEINPADSILVALGNHDVGNGEGDYKKLLNRFLDYNSKYLGNNLEKPYYYRIINGCYMIFLATEDMSVNDCIITDAQYAWLQALLNEASDKNAPIFVFNHHPIHRIEGDDYYKLVNMLGEYDNLLYVNGHTHMSLTEFSFRKQGNVDTVYLPCSAGNSDDAGIGIVVEVYDNEILVRPRNFLTGEWIIELEHSYPISH